MPQGIPWTSRNWELLHALENKRIAPVRHGQFPDATKASNALNARAGSACGINPRNSIETHSGTGATAGGGVSHRRH